MKSLVKTTVLRCTIEKQDSVEVARTSDGRVMFRPIGPRHRAGVFVSRLDAKTLHERLGAYLRETAPKAKRVRR